MSEHAEWLAQLRQALARSGSAGAMTAGYLKQHGVAVGVHEQPTAARWTLTNRIQIHPQYLLGPADAPYPLSLVVHEVQHLRQGWVRALSVYGELEAWQMQFRFLKAMAGRYHERPELDHVISDLVSLPLALERRVLQEARRLMRAYAGKGYRIDLLPLFPLPYELVYRLTGRRPSSS